MQYVELFGKTLNSSVPQIASCGAYVAAALLARTSYEAELRAVVSRVVSAALTTCDQRGAPTQDKGKLCGRTASSIHLELVSLHLLDFLGDKLFAYRLIAECWF